MSLAIAYTVLRGEEMGNLSSVCKHSATAPKDNDGGLATACPQGEWGYQISSRSCSAVFIYWLFRQCHIVLAFRNITQRASHFVSANMLMLLQWGISMLLHGKNAATLQLQRF
jgi:hypothetical protein